MSVWTTGSSGFFSVRLVLAVWLAGAFGIFAFAGGMGLAKSGWVAGLLSIGVAAFVAWIAWNDRVLPLDEKAASRFLSVVFGLAAILSLVQLGRLCVFIVNPAAVGYAFGPSRGVGLPSRHLCLTAYFVAAQSVATVPNIYDEDRLYSFPTDPNTPRKPRIMGSFDIDPYEYPPPFLLLPRTLQIVAPQFLNFRMVWFALNGFIVLIGLLGVVKAFDSVTGTRALLLSPLVLGADITVGTLQIGNLQAAVFAFAMLAMMFFKQHRYAAGGALLAFATVSKMFPGMLIVYLIVRRQWRAVAWTLGICVALVGASLLDTGRTPYLAFLHKLPRLLSGVGFSAFTVPAAVARNLSVPGFLFKLRLFGLANGSYEVMSIVGSIYTLIVLVVTIVVARRKLGRNEQPILWLTILILASLRSPFLPQYGVFPMVWLLTLLAATVVPTARSLCVALIGWLVLNIAIPFTGQDPKLLAAMALVPQVVIVILLTLALRYRSEVAIG